MTHAPAKKRPGASEDDDGDSDTDSTIPPPDGGWGWVVVFASFMIHIVTDGVTYSFGVVQRKLVEHFEAGEGATALVSALLFGITLCSGPIASAFVNKWGCRPVTIAGAILSGLCLALSFLATNIATLYLTIGVGTGFGFGLIYLPAIVSVTCYFERYRSLATGIAVAGSGLGTFIFAPFITYLMKVYGSWQGTVLILAGLALNTAIMGALMRPLEKPKRPPSTELKELPSEKSELKMLLNGDLSKEEQANQLMVQQPQTVVRSAHNIPTAVQDDQSEPSTMPRNVKVLSLNLSSTPHPILSSGHHNHHHHNNHHNNYHQHHNHQHSWRHKGDRDIARWALSQPTLQTTTGSVQHLAGSGVMYRKDIFYRGSLVNIPHYRSASKLSRHTSVEGLGGAKGSSLEVESPDSDVQLTVCGCIPCSPETKDTLAEMLDMSLFKDVIFLLFAVSNFLTSIGFYMPYSYLQAYAESIHIDTEWASGLISIVGIANLVGRLVLGYAADKPWVNRLLVYNVSLSVSGFATILVVVCQDYYSLAVYAAVYGFTIGAYVGLTSVILVDLLGLDKLTNAFGLLLLFQGVASFMGPPIGGWLFDITQSYKPSFWLAGVTLALSGLMLFVVPPIQKRKAARRRQNGKVVSLPASSNGSARPQPV
ncbi:monocarboxylate transporter 9 isoform X3 [Frankliniella occidentalis]|uniref:Monocarboxylate transporter 9 isoform X3 n=1 Tax=Frankliniella occidentalis TaxID=133901 RepID=A0A6J1SVM3_FRAOC|nr:monocarboxylate transporter 9 isoform X3 [Frankliniella occidentalis]